MPNKVLVTGGFGRVGGALIPRLLDSNYQVVVFDVVDRQDSPYHDKVEVIIGDLANYDDVFRAMQGIDIVCHLGALFPPLFFDEAKIIEANVLGTFNVLQAMKNYGKTNRIIFASTDATYATGLSFDQYDAPLTEDMEQWPNNVYGVTKVVNEVAIRKYARLFNFSYIILRFFWSMRSDEMIRLMFEARNYIDDLFSMAQKYITQNLTDEKLGLDNVCKYIGLSKIYFGRLFHREKGISFSNYINKERVEFAKGLLEKTNLRVSEVAYESGFSNSKYFSVVFKSSTGISALEYRRIKRFHSDELSKGTASLSEEG